MVQLPLTATKIAAAQFRKAVASSEAIRDLCIHYNEVLLTQARITAACNALHSVEARFCRWLLQSADRAASDTVTLTQELLAEMPCAAAGRRYQRMTRHRAASSRSRPDLERLSCECYHRSMAMSATLT